jgi:AcrR family transcriptional regulator
MRLTSDAATSKPRQGRALRTRSTLLDAAVDELIEHGYANLTTQGVARRAQVSRGAQQNYFPHKTTLVAAAVRHLAARQIQELQAHVARVPHGPARVRAGLDVLFEQYSGPLFAAIVELSLAARSDDELRDVVAREERNISKKMHTTARTILASSPVADDRSAGELPAPNERWTTVLSAVRGLALLKLLGHPPDVVDRQWQETRRHLLLLLE